MECKLKIIVCFNNCLVELIDTLWNVNMYYFERKTREEIELIDTLWNVNTVAADLGMIIPRINRYIMECKLSSGTRPKKFPIRINRYIMECKSIWS